MISSIILAFVLFSTIIMSQCPTGQTSCSGSCVTLTSDANNCGACGNVCDNSGTCNLGKCVCPPSIQCGYGESVGQNCTCCIDACYRSGSTMWSNTQHSRACPTFTTIDSTPEACCYSCFNNPNCAQWTFNSIDHPNVCQQDVVLSSAQLTTLGITTSSHCVGSLIDYTPFAEASGGRCTDQLTPCYNANDNGVPLEPTGATCNVLVPLPSASTPTPSPSPSPSTPPSPSSPSTPGDNTYNFNCNCDCDNYCDEKYGNDAPKDSTKKDSTKKHPSEHSRRFV